jgi:flagellin-like protein
MRLFRKNELAVSPVIGVILMVAITVILAAVIAAFVFGLGGQQAAAPTASIVAANNPDTTSIDLKIQHKGGDTLKATDWKLSIVMVGNATNYVLSNATNGNFSVGSQIITTTETSGCSVDTPGVNATSMTCTTGYPLQTGQKYDVKLVHIPSNALMVDAVVEVR